MQTDLKLDLDSFMSPHKSANGHAQDGQSQKMFQDYSAVTNAEILLRWLENYLGQKLAFQEMGGEIPACHLGQKGLSNGQLWMRNTSESRNAAAACSLSEIQETGEVARRFFLSPKACAGILRRAKKRGKTLPCHLERALIAVAATGNQKATI